MSSTDEARRLLAQITPGVWKLWGMDVMTDRDGTSNVDTAGLIARTADPDRGLRTFNASFIAAAPRLVADLADKLDAVAALHSPMTIRNPDAVVCKGCDSLWPCTTATLLGAS